MLRPLPLLILILLIATPTLAQDWDRFEIQSTPLAEGVFMLSSRAGGNMAACAGEDGILVVDADYEQLGAKVVAAAAALGAGPRKLLINTHWHFDHVGGNAAFAADGALLIAHENVRRRMQKGQRLEILDEDVPASPREALPMMTFTDRLTFHFNGQIIDVIHPENAHTDGDAILHFMPANVIHTGDLVFNCGYPFVDISSGGSIDGMIAAVKQVLELANEQTRIIPGHGPLATRAEIEVYLGMLQSFRDIVASEKAAGKSLEQILEAKSTAEVDEKWGKNMFPPAQFAEMVYRSLPD